MLGGEPGHRPRRVGRDPDHAGAGPLVVGRVIADPARLGGAPRGVGAGVEVEDDGLPAQLRQRDVAAVLIRKREVGGGVADGEHRLNLAIGAPELVKHLVEAAATDVAGASSARSLPRAPSARPRPWSRSAPARPPHRCRCGSSSAPRRSSSPRSSGRPRTPRPRP